MTLETVRSCALTLLVVIPVVFLPRLLRGEPLGHPSPKLPATGNQLG